MDANGVNVFHAADGDGVVSGVAHNLKLNFLIALDALFNQHLVNRGELEGIDAYLNQLLLVVGKATARAAQGEGGTQHNGVADSLGCRLSLL